MRARRAAGSPRRPQGVYFTVSTAVGAPSVTLPVRWLFWYEKMLPPELGFRPLTFEITVDLASRTNVFGPDARTPLAPLRINEVRSTVTELMFVVGLVPTPIPSKALPVETLSRMCNMVTPVPPSVLNPLSFFSARTRSITTRAEPDPPEGSIVIPETLLLLITLSDTNSFAVTPSGGLNTMPELG